MTGNEEERDAAGCRTTDVAGYGRYLDHEATVGHRKISFLVPPTPQTKFQSATLHFIGLAAGGSLVDILKRQQIKLKLCPWP